MSDLFLSFILGLIQGLTEFLPVSSSAHLLFPSLLFGTNDLGLSFDIHSDDAGQSIRHEAIRQCDREFSRRAPRCVR